MGPGVRRDDPRGDRAICDSLCGPGALLPHPFVRISCFQESAKRFPVSSGAVGWAKAPFAPCPPKEPATQHIGMVGTPSTAHSRGLLALPTLRLCCAASLF